MGIMLRAAVLGLAFAAPLGAQDTARAARRDTTTSAARAPAAVYNTTKRSRADTLRGSYTTPGRRWWDVTFYDLHVAIRPRDSTIAGWNAITYRVVEPPPAARELQIDLMAPLVVDSIVQGGRVVPYRREGNAYFARPAATPNVGARGTITVYYHGRPLIAKNPPWEGGFTWTTDSLGRPWIVTTDQGMGASAWWPNKDTQADEPESQRVAIAVPRTMIDVSNGQLASITRNADSTATYEWFVKNPINNYAIAVAAGSYTSYRETYRGLNGELTLDFWPLDYHLADAKRQFAQVHSMLRCFEGWFGPYPWYDDGYKLIEVPNTGMEHQSAVSYGNGYQNGYRKRDMSDTGLGLTWDYIIIHESAHEWFANNITAKDNADMWVHESFATYAEGLYTECLHGKEAGARYLVGIRRNIRNDRPIIPAYEVNDQGSGDMYPKGAAMLHTIRQLVDDDARWRDILRGLNRTFWHQTVTGRQIEQYMSRQAGRDLSRVFDQYLRTTMIPVLEYRIAGDTVSYRWTNVVPGFDMRVKVSLDGPELAWIRPTTAWQRTRVRLPNASGFRVDPSFYVMARRVPPSQR